MHKRIAILLSAALLAFAAYLAGTRAATVAHAQPPAAYAKTPTSAEVPKSYGKLVTATFGVFIALSLVPSAQNKRTYRDRPCKTPQLAANCSRSSNPGSIAAT